jgi:2,4-diaminopentanoate dehydrogenase
MKSSAPLKVAVWSTGGIGSIAIPAIHRRPDLSLVGVWVHSPEKVGRDAGELANGEAIGLAATDDVDELLALRPDCIVYAASGPDRDAASVPDYVRFLAAGVNVVTTSSTRLIYPPAFDPAYREQLAAAAAEGGASLYASGIEPGFVLDQLPVVLATQSKTIRSIHSCEIGLYDDYPVVDVMMDAMGFGRPMDFEPFIAIPGVVSAEFAAGIWLIADALGVEIDEIRESVERAPTDRRLEVACGTLEAGTGGAIRFKAVGVVDGNDAITIEHVTRMALDVAPDWPTSEHGVGYRIEIEGEPNIRVDLACDLDDASAAGVGGMQAGAGAMVATAMRVVNAVPYVVDAAPGLLSSLELPLTVPRHAFVGSA